MSDIISCKWTSFAHGHDPNGGTNESKWLPGCQDIHGRYSAWPSFGPERFFYTLKAVPEPWMRLHRFFFLGGFSMIQIGSVVSVRSQGIASMWRSPSKLRPLLMSITFPHCKTPRTVKDVKAQPLCCRRSMAFWPTIIIRTTPSQEMRNATSGTTWGCTCLGSTRTLPIQRKP